MGQVSTMTFWGWGEKTVAEKVECTFIDISTLLQYLAVVPPFQVIQHIFQEIFVLLWTWIYILMGGWTEDIAADTKQKQTPVFLT